MSSIKYGTVGLKLLKLFPFPPPNVNACLTVSTFRSVQNQCKRYFSASIFIRQVAKGASRGITEVGEFRLILRPDNGDDLIFVSHQYHEFRREHIGRVWAGRPFEFDNHNFSLRGRTAYGSQSSRPCRCKALLWKSIYRTTHLSSVMRTFPFGFISP